MLYGPFANEAKVTNHSMSSVVELVSCHQSGQIYRLMKSDDKNKHKKKFELVIELSYPIEITNAFIFACHMVCSGIFLIEYFSDNQIYKIKSIESDLLKVSVNIV